MKKTGLLLICLINLLSACHSPLPSQPSEAEVAAELLRQTLAALSHPSTPTPSSGVWLPTPGLELSPPAYAPPTPIPQSYSGSYHYLTRSGDTTLALAVRFDVDPREISSQVNVAPEAYLPPGTNLVLPTLPEEVSSSQLLLPDADLVYSPAAGDFDLSGTIREFGGFLSTYQEEVGQGKLLIGSEIVDKVARELSVNPRLLLGLIEYRSGWLSGSPPGASREDYPLGFFITGREGLYEELRIAATQLNIAYYGWRSGEFTTVKFQGGGKLRLDPTLNAGTAAIIHLFSLFYSRDQIPEVLDTAWGFPPLYHNLFGDAWGRASNYPILLPPDLHQPTLSLPFSRGEKWSFTGGPHLAWNAGTPRGAVDFSPITGEKECAVSTRWVTAPAAGQVVRSADNTLALDLDEDGNEGTGWVLVFFHLADQDLIPESSPVSADQPIGHPSCQGGVTTGTHVHLARKYNGEWLPVDGPVPLILSGWIIQAGERMYQGTMIKGDLELNSHPGGGEGSTIIR